MPIVLIIGLLGGLYLVSRAGERKSRYDINFVSAMVSPRAWSEEDLTQLLGNLGEGGFSLRANQVGEILTLKRFQYPIITSYELALTDPDAFTPESLELLAQNLESLNLRLLANLVRTDPKKRF